MRERSIVSWRRWAIISTQRSTADSIPSPSRSIFRKPASEQESLSHCTIWRPSIAAGSTGQQSISGRVETIIPPECWDRWRGSPAASADSSASQRQRPSRSRPSPSATAMSFSTPCANQPSDPRATRSISPGGSPSALPSSRIAPRALKVGKAATSADCSRP